MKWMLAAGALVASLAVLTGPAQAGPGQAKRTGKSAVNALDVSWLHTSLQGDKFEIIGGRVALRHSFDPQVRALARRLIHDHSQSYAEGAAIARRIGVKVPDEPTPSEGWELRTLMRYWGSSFDRMYASLEVYDHHQDIEETTDEIERGWNAEVKGAAKTDLPVLQTHLRLSQSARAAVR
jgi:putative membrane protein